MYFIKKPVSDLVSPFLKEEGAVSLEIYVLFFKRSPFSWRKHNNN